VKDFAKGVFKFVGVIVLLAAIAAGVLYGFFVKVLEVGHNGMAPTMVLGDQVLVWKTQELGLGEVALCGHPQQPGVYVLGRVVGRRGQIVGMERGALTINGETPEVDTRGVVAFEDAELGRTLRMRYAYERILTHDHPIFWREDGEPRMRRPHTVRGGLFLMNDNRTHRGEDSRTYGEVAEESCVGRVFLRLTAAETPAELGNAALDIIE
jgi:signal peptidase I